MKRDQAIAAVQNLHEFLRESRPAWTATTPTLVGYYWVRDGKCGYPQVVLVRIDYGESGTPLVVQSGHPANTGIQYLRDYKGVGVQWAGPIEEPTP